MENIDITERENAVFMCDELLYFNFLVLAKPEEDKFENFQDGDVFYTTGNGRDPTGSSFPGIRLRSSSIVKDVEK